MSSQSSSNPTRSLLIDGAPPALPPAAEAAQSSNPPASTDGPAAGAAKTPSRKRKVDGFIADPSLGVLRIQMAKAVELILTQKNATDCDLTMGILLNFYNDQHIGEEHRSVSFEWPDEQSLSSRVNRSGRLAVRQATTRPHIWSHRQRTS